MPPKRRKTKKKRKTKRRAAPRPQIARICNGPLSQLLAQPGESTSALRLTLGEAVKRLWAYARLKGLTEGRVIKCNGRMQALFNESQLGMFAISGALSEHMRGAGSSSSGSSGSSTTTSTSAASSSAAAPATAAPAIGSGPLLTLSPALTSLICGSTDGGGGGNRQLTLTLADTLRRVGNYITRNGLRDQDDRRKIACDAALAEIVGKTTFTIFEAKALLAKHLSPAYLGGGGRSASAGAGGGSSGGAALGGGAGQSSSSRGRIAVSDDEDEEEEEDESEEEEGEEEGEEEDDDDDEDVPLVVKKEAAAAAAAAPQEVDHPAADADAAVAGGVCEPRKRKRKERPPPAEFICPITQDVMTDPVTTVDGQTYERSAIARWLARKNTSPLTGVVLESKTVIPNHSLRKLIEEKWRG